MGKESYLPLEMCRTVLKNKKKLDEKETADMIKVRNSFDSITFTKKFLN
jgi:hypothetical protein